jgi:UDPglucose 6-dehydrogenase
MINQPFQDVQPVPYPRRITVIGSGYVGLTLSACLALLGHEVRCTDKSAHRIARLSAGEVPIVEEGMAELLALVLERGRLTFDTDNVRAATDAEFVFLCLPTPDGGDGQADLTFVREVARELGPHLRTGTVVITKSTVPVGTAELVEGELRRRDVHVASNPEFLAEGTAIGDCLSPDRIIIGARTESVARQVADLYGPDGCARSILTDVPSAELIKYASNAYLATRLTFVNSMAALCEAVGADIGAVTAGMGADHRIGPSFLRAGPGWGGSCFPKDTRALVHTAESHGCDMQVVKAAIAENSRHTARVADRVCESLGGSLQDRQIALWGLTFKAGTDDLRESPALEIAHQLIRRGASVRAYDPTVAEGRFEGIEIRPDPIAAAEAADALVVATEWDEFRSVDLAELASIMPGGLIMDTRNVLDPAAVTAHGLHYQSLGRTRRDGPSDRRGDGPVGLPEDPFVGRDRSPDLEPPLLVNHRRTA